MGMDSSNEFVFIQGIKFFKPIRGLLKRLHKEHAHHNRKLHYDEYVSLLLLAFFQPTSQTLRWVQKASGLKRVQSKLGVSRASLGSLSDASRVFDPELARQIFEQLAAEACASNAPRRPDDLPANLQLIAADGTLWETLPKMTRELFQEPLTRRKKGVFKGHIQFDIFKHVPCKAEFSMSDDGEAAHLMQQLQANALYVLDRGFVNYELYSKIMAAGSSFLVRIKDVCAVEVIEERPLEDDARRSGAMRDALIRLGSGVSRIDRPLRLIHAKITLPPPHNLHPIRKRGKYKAYDASAPREQEILLVTDCLELSVQTLLLLYRYRWQIELFFRWFKCVLGSKHLMAQSENGLNLQMYIALIASLLIVVWTGRRPTKDLLMMLNFYLIGWASWDELQSEIRRAPACNP